MVCASAKRFNINCVFEFIDSIHSQGTVLDPLLFIIRMCDINSGIHFSSMVSFAGDTRLYYSISNADDLAI